MWIETVIACFSEQIQISMPVLYVQFFNSSRQAHSECASENPAERCSMEKQIEQSTPASGPEF